MFVASKNDLSHLTSQVGGVNSIVCPELFDKKVKELKLYQKSVDDIKNGNYPLRFCFKLLLRKLGIK